MIMMSDSVVVVMFFFFKQKTAYEMRISDWSSDVCSSDLCAELPTRTTKRNSTMDSGDEEHFCHTCKIVAAYIDLSNGFTQDLSAALIGPMQLIYLALVGIWIIFQGYRLILILATIMDVAKEFIFAIGRAHV